MTAVGRDRPAGSGAATSLANRVEPADRARSAQRPEGIEARRDGHDPKPRLQRLASLDVTRGLALVILLLAGNPFLREHLPAQLKHPGWHGLSFADLFFPLFLFVVGVAMTLSRRAGSTRLVLRRTGLLLVVGIAISSFKHGEVHLTGVLQHIAGAYLLAWLVTRAPRRMQVPIATAILAAIWAGFLLWADPGSDPWGEDGSFAHAVNGWLIGGFSTEGVLQTVTSSVSVLGGAFVGRAVKERRDPRELLRRVAGHAIWLIGAGLLLALLVPINKRLWTPSYTVLTIGTSCAFFAFFIWVVDIHRRVGWVTPMRELGANPIAVYVGFIVVRALIDDYSASVPALAPFGSDTAGALVYSSAWLFAGWLFARWLYRRRVFLRL
jgi:predicted acyltransferase